MIPTIETNLGKGVVPMILGGYINRQLLFGGFTFSFLSRLRWSSTGSVCLRTRLFYSKILQDEAVLRLSADPGPTEIGFRLGNTHQQERQAA